MSQILHLLVTPSFYAGMGIGFFVSALVAAFTEGASLTLQERQEIRKAVHPNDAHGDEMDAYQYDWPVRK